MGGRRITDLAGSVARDDDEDDDDPIF